MTRSATTSRLRVLVAGANGQVGHELLRALRSCTDGPGAPVHEAALPSAVRKKGEPVRRRLEVIPATRTGTLDDGAACARIDLSERDDLTRALDHLAPDLIINAAAYTMVDRAEDEPELAQRVNAEAVGAIAGWAARHGARVVHYSTDYVFDGAATRPYREDDAPAPLGAYGRSKLSGERALAASGARHLVLRTAWVYSARGHNFLRTMLRLGGEGATLRVVDDQIGAPTPAGVIAAASVTVLAQWLEDADPARDGLYHLVTAGRTSWCGFARALFAGAQAAGLLPRVPEVQAIRTADYPTRAHRPAWSVLDTAKLRGVFDVALPEWQAALGPVIAELARRA